MLTLLKYTLVLYRLQAAFPHIPVPDTLHVDAGRYRRFIGVAVPSPGLSLGSTLVEWNRDRVRRTGDPHPETPAGTSDGCNGLDCEIARLLGLLDFASFN